MTAAHWLGRHGYGTRVLKATMTSWTGWLCPVAIALHGPPKNLAIPRPPGKGWRLDPERFALRTSPWRLRPRRQPNGWAGMATAQDSWGKHDILEGLALPGAIGHHAPPKNLALPSRWNGHGAKIPEATMTSWRGRLGPVAIALHKPPKKLAIRSPSRKSWRSNA